MLRAAPSVSDFGSQLRSKPVHTSALRHTQIVRIVLDSHSANTHSAGGTTGMLANFIVDATRAHPLQAACGISKHAASLQRYTPPDKGGPEATAQQQLQGCSPARIRQAAGGQVAHLRGSALYSKLLCRRVNTLISPAYVLRTCKLVKAGFMNDIQKHVHLQLSGKT